MKYLVSLFFILCSSVSLAKETISIVYGWTPADSAANYSRTLVKEANELQDKYQFIFDTKSGAGGSIVANHALNTPNVIAAHSTAFFVRPNFYPNESYDFGKFKELMPQCAAPMAVSSMKYKSWKEVPRDKPLTIATSGLGVTTHLIAEQIRKTYPNITVVPYKSTSDGILAVMSEQVDMAVSFVSEAEPWTKDNKTGKVSNIIGVTGPNKVKNYPLMINSGFPEIFARIVNTSHLVIPEKMDSAKAKEINAILMKAATKKSVLDAYAVDFCKPSTIKYEQNDQFFASSLILWRELSQGIRLEGSK